jgi:hypothetical protein
LAFWGAIFGSVDVGTRCRDPGTGGICENVSRWIVPTCNSEITPIIELPPVFSVEIAVAGAENGCFRIEMQGSLCQGVVVWCSNANKG